MRSTQKPCALTKRVQELMDGHTDRSEEKEILDLFRDADDTSLNCALQQLDTAALFNDVDDHWFGPKNKTELLKMFSKDRLQDLEVPARSAVVGGLQVGHTTLEGEEQDSTLAGGIEEQAIRDIFLGSQGRQLTDLKNAVNAGADKYDMQKLMFDDLDDEGFRAAMFEHFQSESSQVTSRVLKPLSDIDDTFYSSLKDKRYPGDTVYPGVLAFYDELDKGVSEDVLGDLTFLTARPDEATGTVKSRTHNTLRENGVKEAAVLLGSLTGLINNEAMARKKMENFQEYTQIYPEYDFSWVGDSGQGDALLGERMLSDHGDRVKGVFIHNVTELSDDEKAAFREKGVRVFDTYLGAGLEAYELGLIGKDGVERIASVAEKELNAINFDSQEQKEQRLAELARDKDRLKALLS